MQARDFAMHGGATLKSRSGVGRGGFLFKNAAFAAQRRHLTYRYDAHQRSRMRIVARYLKAY